MLYAPLPDKPSSRDIWRFSTYGVRGDIRRLLIASAAASAVALLMPVATGAILGTAIPDGRYTLLSDMLLLLIAAAVGGIGFQMARAMSLIRLGTHLDQRLQAAVWDRVLRLRMSFFRQYLIGDLTWRILGVDTMRRILTGQSVNAVIGGVFSLASLAHHADLRRRAHAVRRRLRLCRRRAAVRRSVASRSGSSSRCSPIWASSRAF